MGEDMMRQCDVCDKYFIPKSVKMLRCSELCRRRKWADWKKDRDHKIKEDLFKKAPLKQCRYCEKEFKAVPHTKVFCNKICRDNYEVPKRKRPKQKYGINKKFVHGDHPLKHYTINHKTDTPEQKEQHRITLNEAVQNFLLKGGKINKLDPIPSPFIPSVGSRDWEWETTVGLSYFGSEEYTEPNHLNEEHITPYGNRLGK